MQFRTALFSLSLSFSLSFHVSHFSHINTENVINTEERGVLISALEDRHFDFLAPCSRCSFEKGVLCSFLISHLAFTMAQNENFYTGMWCLADRTYSADKQFKLKLYIFRPRELSVVSIHTDDYSCMVNVRAFRHVKRAKNATSRVN
jgi:hypothetical protein